MDDQIWTLDRGDGPLVAAAIHDGGELREELHSLVAIDSEARRREEDPYTASWTGIAPTRIVGLRSRFEVDLNRPRDKAVYRSPEDCWGLRVWKSELPDDVAARSLAEYDAFYSMLRKLYSELADRHGHFVVFDLHAYNHRRDGAGRSADPNRNPQVNVGTGTLRARQPWSRLIGRFIDELGACAFGGERLDVRENVKFQGGEHPRWTHAVFPGSACVLAVEVKKFFMDERTGVPDQKALQAVGEALASTVPGVLEELARL
jgi:N-formylglutamate amidohydrolase